MPEHSGIEAIDKRPNADIELALVDGEMDSFDLLSIPRCRCRHVAEQELKTRVNQQRKLLLFTRLSEALREFEINQCIQRRATGRGESARSKTESERRRDDEADREIY